MAAPSLSAIGSMNFDNRSMALNDESTLMVLDSTMGEAMNQIFLDDLTHAVEITLPQFRKRSLFERIFEGGANLVARVL